jgi:hypothetical protein
MPQSPVESRFAGWQHPIPALDQIASVASGDPINPIPS